MVPFALRTFPVLTSFHVEQIIQHIIMECSNPRCAMRFPVLVNGQKAEKCPMCGHPTHPGSHIYEEHRAGIREKRPSDPSIEALLDNIRSIYNVGSMFRTSDGMGISTLHLCGMTPTPNNPRLAKTALGAEKAVAWSYGRNGLAVARALKDAGKRLWALEGGPSSDPLEAALPDRSGAPIVLVVGNEVSGVDPAILTLCDRILHIPMSGVKSSLNAAIAFGIAAYTLRMP